MRIGIHWPMCTVFIRRLAVCLSYMRNAYDLVILRGSLQLTNNRRRVPQMHGMPERRGVLMKLRRLVCFLSSANAS